MPFNDLPTEAMMKDESGNRLSLVWIRAGAGIVLVLLIVNVAIAVRNIRQLSEDSKRVAHTHKVIIGLQELLSLVKDAETGQRGFIITDDARYLEPYNQAIGKIDNKVNEIAGLTKDNAHQQARIPELRQRIAKRLQTLDHNIALKKLDGFGAVRESIKTNQGKNEMDALRDVIGVMINEEEVLLADRAQKTEQTHRLARFTSLLSGLLALVAVGAFLVLLRRHLTARAKAAVVIAEQAERLRTTLASIGDAVIATDAEGQITMMNAVAESLTGWKIEQAAGLPLKKVFNIVNETTRQLVESPVTRALREGIIVGLANHTVLIAKDGTEWPIDDSAAPIRCKEGQIVGCVLVFRDITERKQAEDQLRELAANLSEANRRKNEFLAVLAHELRNPLAPIRNALQIMRLAEGNGETVKFASEIMERQVDHMVRLVDDLLDLSRISQGRIELRHERVDLSQVLHHAIETIRPSVDQAGHKLTVTLPSQPVYLHADPTRLAQVFGNLLSNSCKYSDPGCQISLAVEEQSGEVLVSVKDTGVGIPPEMLSKIFDMFMQVDHSLDRSQGGLGIGLTLVQRLVEMHGGSVSAFSEGKGRGSEFVVRLPILSEAKQPLQPATKEVAARTIRRFLVVDDNRDSAESLAIWLKINGNETHTAFDGLEAVEAAATIRPDVILLDIGLPKLNGYEAARKIRQQPWGKAVVLVALTGWGQEEDRRRSSDAGFDGHLVKPVDFDRLMNVLANIDTSAPPEERSR